MGPGAPGGVTTGCSAVTSVPSAFKVRSIRVGSPSVSDTVMDQEPTRSDAFAVAADSAITVCVSTMRSPPWRMLALGDLGFGVVRAAAAPGRGIDRLRQHSADGYGQQDPSEGTTRPCPTARRHAETLLQRRIHRPTSARYREGVGETCPEWGMSVGYLPVWRERADGVCQPSNPISRARAAASVRLLTPSFAKMLAECFLTVSGEKKTRSPISRFVRPAAMSARISCSRGLSGSKPLGSLDGSIPAWAPNTASNRST